MVNLTFETSCVMSLLGKDNTPEDELHALNEMVRLANEGRIKIWVSWKSEWESFENLDKNTDENRRRIWEDTIAALNNFPHNAGAFIVGVSRLGIDTVLGSEGDANFVEDIKEIAYPDTPKGDIARGHVFDTAILADHRMQGNDIFVTRDKKFLKPLFTSQLKEKWNIVIANPCTALEMLN